MIRIFALKNGLGDVAPQAIFWRPLPYFTTAIKNDVDDLDEYKFATFEVGNWLRFELRRYAGHPASTVTLYLSLLMDNPTDISHAINRVVQEFQLPRFATAWRREQPFSYGLLLRVPNDRLREPEARLLVLKVAANMPGRTATVQQIIDRAHVLFEPSEVDLLPSRSRSRQPQWHQIIRNVISHRHTANSPFTLGLAVRTEDGLTVTETGISLLRSMGFLNSA